jgi:glutaredoxin
MLRIARGMQKRDRHIRTGPCQREGAIPAQPSRRACNQRSFALQRFVAARHAGIVPNLQAPHSIWVPVNLCYTSRMPEPRQVVVYSRKGCHLCEIVKETLTKLERRGGFTWQEIDVDSDDQLRRQFTDEVPVIFIDGRKAFKYRLDEQEFLRKLAN